MVQHIEWSFPKNHAEVPSKSNLKDSTQAVSYSCIVFCGDCYSDGKTQCVVVTRLDTVSALPKYSMWHPSSVSSAEQPENTKKMVLDLDMWF